MPRCARTVLAVVTACAVTVGAVEALPTAAGAAKPSKASHSKKSTHKKAKHKKAKRPKLPKPVTIAPGATVKYRYVKITKKNTVRVALLRFDLRNRHIALDATVPRGAVGAGRQTITTQTRLRRGAVGINADFFDIRSASGAPNGGVVVGGALLKSPRKNWDANLYVRGGRARIGALTFTGSITRLARPGTPAPAVDPAVPVTTPATTPAPITVPPVPATTRSLYSVNSVADLKRDRLVLVTGALAVPRFGRACTVAFAVPTRGAGHYVVTGVYRKTTAAPRVRGRGVAVVACGTGPRATWLGRLVKGDTVAVSISIAGGTPSMLVSGGQVLVRDGRGFADRDGKRITGRNPETFACVSGSGRTVLLGTVDGRREGSSGVTIPELRRYLLTLHCRHGIVFDGGGSSTLVGRRAGTSAVRVLNRPSDRGGARRVSSGLVVHRR